MLMRLGRVPLPITYSSKPYQFRLCHKNYICDIFLESKLFFSCVNISLQAHYFNYSIILNI